MAIRTWSSVFETSFAKKILINRTVVGVGRVCGLGLAESAELAKLSQKQKQKITNGMVYRVSTQLKTGRTGGIGNTGSSAVVRVSTGPTAPPADNKLYQSKAGCWNLTPTLFRD